MGHFIYIYMFFQYRRNQVRSKVSVVIYCKKKKNQSLLWLPCNNITLCPLFKKKNNLLYWFPENVYPVNFVISYIEHRIKMESSTLNKFLTIEELYYIIYCVLWTLKEISYEILSEKGFRQSEILAYDLVINMNHNAKWKI